MTKDMTGTALASYMALKKKQIIVPAEVPVSNIGNSRAILINDFATFFTTCRRMLGQFLGTEHGNPFPIFVHSLVLRISLDV
jgi:hypothetical protein